MDGRQRDGKGKPLRVSTFCNNKSWLWSELVISLLVPVWKLGFQGQ